ncbi:aminotransferase class I/II-fold pyridoxal phosphate-dependent enzyme [Streptomyces sp. NBS 14/10]|uniref:aminotransferase class I/II-fold pyridoxal phosphate-dependent enzyme n=1 Tax=Streptomyces sp. NBS 14/10 TaxID=1945643 RepID=UPI00211B5C54|nr:aminotransferase class I/II-fold pyridoxal phosphate-dependent enzyme [Streptomyces sp. NBS 14/10]KAK1177235.1 aminotransferase class I/II-fold pyridoxal phosphate-dependent enzyme [Streptomyces sp. NBS 14/10]
MSWTAEVVIVPISGTTATEIAGSVRDLIASGELAPRDLLPPVRTLAAELGVNRNTVAAAYRQLVAAGVAATQGRGGTMVTGMPQLAREGAGFGGRLIDLASGNPDPELLPDVLAAARRGEYRQPLYGAPAVDPGLAEWAADGYAEDIAGQPFRVLVAGGAADATERLLNAYLTRGDAVAVEDPCFLGTIGTVRLNGYRTAPVAVDHAGMRPEALRAALESGARAVVCTPRAHNPTGASLTAGRAAELRAILAEHPQVLIIEDDHFSAVSTVSYHRITPPQSATWALVRSVSKFLGPDLRLALVAADEETARRLETRLSAGTMWVSLLLQHTARELLLDPKARARHERARTAYAERSARLMKELNARGISTPAAYRPDGLNVWIDLDTPARPVVDALARRGWLVRPGDLFATGEADRQALRVTTATLTEQRAREFAADLAAVLDDPDAA